MYEFVCYTQAQLTDVNCQVVVVYRLSVQKPAYEFSAARVHFL